MWRTRLTTETAVLLAVIAAGMAVGSSAAAGFGRPERALKAEPAYQTKRPKYGVLVFGAAAANPVWLVLDGATLYVDRNGNGDLTEPGEKVAAKADPSRNPVEFGYTFEAGDLSIGGKLHRGLRIMATPLALYADNPALASYATLQAAVKTDPKAIGVNIFLDVESTRLNGGGSDGRLSYWAGLYDLNGVLQFADRPDAAPIIHLDGPMQATFYGQRPTFRLNRENDLVLAVGTPGRGPGTFASLLYEGTIPEKLYPSIEIAFPSAAVKDGLVRECYELKQRC